MKKIWIGIGIIAVVILAIVLILTQTRSEPEKVRIGVILPLTGDGATYGKEIKQGIDLAIDEINEEEGIRGRPVVAFYEDDQGLPQPAVSALQKLIDQNKVNVVIGGAFSTPALAMLPICNRRHMLFFSPTASSPELSVPNDYFFRNWPSDTFEGNSMAEFAVSRLGLKKFAILYSNSDYGLGLREVFKKKVIELGGNTVFEDSFSEGMTDFRTQLSKIKQSQPDGIYLVGWYKEFALILRQAREIGVGSQFLSCVTFNKPELLEIAGDTAEGVYFTQPTYDPQSNEANVENFVKSYRKKYDEDPGVYAAHGYDSVKLLALAMKTKGFSVNDIMEGLYSISGYEGTSGMTTFDSNGDVAKPARIFVVRNRKYVPVEKDVRIQ